MMDMLEYASLCRDNMVNLYKKANLKSTSVFIA